MEHTQTTLAIGWSIHFLVMVLLWYIGRNPTSEPNWFLGYRTSSSMKNEDTWKSAHHLCAKFTVHMVLFSLLPAAASLTIPDLSGNLSFGIMIGNLIVSLGYIIIRTEIGLSKRYDSKGNRKNPDHAGKTS